MKEITAEDISDANGTYVKLEKDISSTQNAQNDYTQRYNISHSNYQKSHANCINLENQIAQTNNQIIYQEKKRELAEENLAHKEGKLKWVMTTLLDYKEYDVTVTGNNSEETE